MFSVLYSFSIHPDKKDQFLKAWSSLTQLIIEYEAGLGSRLHEISEKEYIAYAQWPDRETWQNSGGNLPESASKIRADMREACIEIKTVYELKIVKDLLVHPQ